MAPSKHTKNIIEALDLAELEPEEQEELLLDLDELIFKGTMVRLIERMDEKTASAFNALLDEDASEDDIEAFLQKHVPDADSAITDTVAELTNDILAVTQK
jgi:hypothetical protein